MTFISHFIRAIRLSDLNAHLEKIGSSVTADDSIRGAGVSFFTKILSQLEVWQRDQLVVDIERIHAMTDELGQAALLELLEWREQLVKLDGAHIRSHWLFLRSGPAFRKAEEIRYAEEHRNASRLWDCFVAPMGASARTDDAAVEALRSAIAAKIAAGPLQIEHFARAPRSGAGHAGLLQVTIYSEGLPQDDLSWNNERVVNHPRKPVKETSIVYDPDNGAIEVAGRDKGTRERIAQLFARIMLGTEIPIARFPARIYNLTPLLRSGDLPTDAEDGIHPKLTQLTLVEPDGILQETFSVPFESERTLHDELEGRYGINNPLRRGTRPIRAQIDVRFDPTGDRPRGKKVRMVLGAPRQCNLRGKTEKERLLLDRYLPLWGLKQAPAA